MQKITIEMPAVRTCDVTNCTYNKQNRCSARAITIGDTKTPNCDTFVSDGNHTRTQMSAAGVGACKVRGCKYNDDYECMADSIDVTMKDGQTWCNTYTERT